MENINKKHKNTKWCKECGRSVDLRKKGSYKLSKIYRPRNEEYGYICSDKCRKDFKEKLRAFGL